MHDVRKGIVKNNFFNVVAAIIMELHPIPTVMIESAPHPLTYLNVACVSGAHQRGCRQDDHDRHRRPLMCDHRDYESSHGKPRRGVVGMSGVPRYILSDALAIK